MITATNYESLCRWVDAIDPAAAAYMRGPEVRSVPGFNGRAKALVFAFIWDCTPQGHKYWENISKKLLIWVQTRPRFYPDGMPITY